jgi:hypothetical protein
MTLRLNSTGGGYIEIDAPNTASNFSLTAPIANGTLDTTGRAGNILQVVSNTTTTETIIASTSYQDTGIFESITSTQANSKFMIFASMQFRVFRNSGDVGASIELQRNISGGAYSSLYTDGNNYAMGYCSAISSNLEMSYRAPLHILDSPSVSSGTTLSYKIRGATRGGSNAVHFQDDGYYVSSLTILEIAA